MATADAGTDAGLALHNLVGTPAHTPEYGRVTGITTPQANTTVEPEMQLLLCGTVLTARLTSPIADSRQRLLDYFDRLPATLAQFDVAPLAAAGFACTGSCYLVGQEEEERLLAQMIAQADVQTKLTELGLNPGFMARAHYTAFIQNEIRTWGPVIRAAGVKGN